MKNKIEIITDGHSYEMEVNYRKFEEGKNYYFRDNGQNYYRIEFKVIERDEEKHKIKILFDGIERIISIDYWDARQEMLYINDDHGNTIFWASPFEVFDIERHVGVNNTYDYILKNKKDIVEQLTQLLKNNKFANCWYSLSMDKNGKLSLERYWQRDCLMIIHGKFYNNSTAIITDEQISEILFEDLLEKVYRYNKEVEQ